MNFTWDGYVNTYIHRIRLFPIANINIKSLPNTIQNILNLCSISSEPVATNRSLITFRADGNIIFGGDNITDSVVKKIEEPDTKPRVTPTLTVYSKELREKT